MTGPIRYAWSPHGMRQSETNFGPTRYINEHEHDRVVGIVRETLRKTLPHLSGHLLYEAQKALGDV